MFKISRLFLILCSLTILYGCALGWFAAGGATAIGGYKFMEGNVTGEYPISFNKAWDAANRTLAEMKINVTESVNKTDRGRIKALRKDGQIVTVILKGRGEQVTSISIRVGKLGDREESQKLHDSIASIAGVK